MNRKLKLLQNENATLIKDISRAKLEAYLLKKELGLDNEGSSTNPTE